MTYDARTRAQIRNETIAAEERANFAELHVQFGELMADMQFTRECLACAEKLPSEVSIGINQALATAWREIDRAAKLIAGTPITDVTR